MHWTSKAVCKTVMCLTRPVAPPPLQPTTAPLPHTFLPLHPPASLHAFPAHPWITLCTLGSQRALRIKDKSGSWIARIQGIKDRILQRRLSARKESRGPRGLLVGNQDSRGSGKNDPDEDSDQPDTGCSSFSQLFCHASPPAELNAWTATLKKVERKSLSRLAVAHGPVHSGIACAWLVITVMHRHVGHAGADGAPDAVMGVRRRDGP